MKEREIQEMKQGQCARARRPDEKITLRHSFVFPIDVVVVTILFYTRKKLGRKYELLQFKKLNRERERTLFPVGLSARVRETVPAEDSQM